MAPPPPPPPPRTLLLILILHPLLPVESAGFVFPSFSSRNLTLLGDSYLRNGTLGLTRNTRVPSSSRGTATYNLPFRLRDPPASFSTNFTFSVTNPNPESHGGDGLTFFLSPSNLSLGESGPYLGLFDPTAKNASSPVAVEFGPCDNHVGVDIGSPVSVATVELGRFGIDLKSGNAVSAWIDYRQEDGIVEVRLAGSENKPPSPVLSARIDLSKSFEEYMYVGFSASTEGSTELHTIQRWSFETYVLSSPPPHPPPCTRNATDSSWRAIPAMPVAKSRRSLSFVLGIVGPVALAAVLVAILWVSIKRGKKEGFKPEFLKGPRQFSYRELKSSTKGFSSGRILGNGAFGTVYRGTDPKTGASYAVKRSKRAGESKTEFAAELAIIASLRHKNLVQLQGWCSEKDELLLVYEYMPNGSLDRVLYQRPGSGPCAALDFARRYNVAVGMASVLAYLHGECEQRVIHRDVKTSNIMLDSEFSPRLGDFGLARLMDHGRSPVSTLTAGTMGYLAPEYLQYGTFTEKTDVFSYGVVVLEVCCGRRPIDKEGETLVNLVDWVWALHSQDRIGEAADRRLEEEGGFEGAEMERLLLLGLSCVNPKCDERPSMRRVLQILNCEAEPLPVPKTKPLLLFASSASLSLQDIVSDVEASATSSSLYELKLN